MATLLDLTNRVLVDCGLAAPVSTVQGVSEQSVVGRVVKALRDGQKRASSKAPNASLRQEGSIRTADDLEIPKTGQTLAFVNGNEVVNLIQTTGADPNTTISDYEADHGSVVGKLINKKEENTTYRIGVRRHLSGQVNLTLHDHGGNVAKYPGTTDSASTATIAQNRYQLPANFKNPIGSWRDFFNNTTLEYKASELFDIEVMKDRSGSFTLGAPWLYTIRSSQSVGGIPRFFIELYPVPDDVYQYPFTYEGSPTLMVADEDVSGWSEEYELAIESYARWHSYKYIKGDLEQAIDEKRNWVEIIGDQIKQPLSSMESVQAIPETQRTHWQGAYDF